jgi:uncharacterized membrane protein
LSLSHALFFLHLTAAISWIGGMIFLSLVLSPLVRARKAAPEYMALFRSAARRFRVVVWSAIAILLSTGPLLLGQRGLSLVDPGGWPSVLRIKIGLVGVLLILSLSHDLLLGPQIMKMSAIPERSRSSWQQALIRTSAWLPRLALLFAFGVVAAAIVLVRS